MPHATSKGRAEIQAGAAEEDRSAKIALPHDLFPYHPALPERGPLPKQLAVFELILSGAVTGGGIVNQGGKGSAKTMNCAAIDITLHHQDDGTGKLLYPGLRSFIGRETYGSLMTSTWDEYKRMLDQLPPQMVKSVTAPTKNSMGTVEWAVGGITLLCTLSDTTIWESANIGLAQVDEAHRSRRQSVEFLEDRIRQANAPRCLILHTNPYGKSYFWRWAHPRSPDRRACWAWIQTSMLENPTLPVDYKRRMVEKYPRGTLGYRRWVLGESAQLEGAAFQDIFDPDPDNQMHVIEPFEIPAEWPRGRGIDWGIDNPTVAVWGAYHPRDHEWYIYRTHTQAGRSATWQAQKIMALEAQDPFILHTPADPSMWARTQSSDSNPSKFYSVADKFHQAGCRITQANNDRKAGMDLITELLAPDDARIHPIHLCAPAPRFFIFNIGCNYPTIECFETIRWREEARTGTTGSPDDVQKINDHWYDGARYLVMERPRLTESPKSAPERTPPAPEGTMGYRGYRRYGR